MLNLDGFDASKRQRFLKKSVKKDRQSTQKGILSKIRYTNKTINNNEKIDSNDAVDAHCNGILCPRALD